MIGSIIKSLRENKDLSRYDFARKMEITYHALSKYETNERKPDYDLLIKIATYFGVSTDYLLGVSDSLTQKTNTSGQQKSESAYTPADYTLLDMISNDSMLKEVVAEYKVLSTPQREAVLAMVKAMKK